MIIVNNLGTDSMRFVFDNKSNCQSITIKGAHTWANYEKIYAILLKKSWIILFNPLTLLTKFHEKYSILGWVAKLQLKKWAWAFPKIKLFIQKLSIKSFFTNEKYPLIQSMLFFTELQGMGITMRTTLVLSFVVFCFVTLSYAQNGEKK